VNDTSPEMDKMVAERYKLMTPDAALLAFAEWNG
jgi:hypothetical protein